MNGRKTRELTKGWPPAASSPVHAITLPRMHAELPTQLVELLRTLSDELVAQRLAQEEDAPSTPSTAPMTALTRSAPLFAALHAVNRDTLSFARGCKQQTQAARLEMDSAHLKLQVSSLASCIHASRALLTSSTLLQNLMFERNHLEREIHKCEQFE